ncbi:MAG: AraC family transcriptional regulator, partial [Lachnospiraceae bacterium]|nr:AraC family transcriptional regulator [Lachnospiraceae bacterium]
CPGIIKMVYGGPISKSEDMRRFYENPLCNGYIGGSAFERIPIEKAITDTVRSFRNYDGNDVSEVQLNQSASIDDVDFIRLYIDTHYSEPISLDMIAGLIHRSYSYLSTKFSKTTGMTFTKYLIHFRMDKAVELMSDTGLQLNEIAEMSGYHDYTQFSKTFKKYMGMSPSNYRLTIK